MKRFASNGLQLLRHLMVSVLTALIAVGPAQLAFAGPHQISGGNGKGTVTQASDTLWVVNAQNGAIIKYSTFDIAHGETVRFETGDGGLVRVLNRIDSRAPTKINGAITEQAGKNFMIYIVNPAGVFFGSDAQINVAGLQAAAGNLSDKDFARGIDHFTNLKGKVENAGQIGTDNPDSIVTNAVALVGRSVANSGDINADGWIVMAAGRDVFIGRDTNGNGLLLRVEGGADAVFNKKAVGVTNTGELNVASVPTATQPSIPAGRITLGAGDLYGTAIFNTGAIHAREVALQASNKGDVALAGTVAAGTLNVTFKGDKTGKLVGAGDVTEHTLNANTINLRAIGEKGQVVVQDRFFLRNEEGTGHTANVNVEQRAAMTTSNLAKLGLGLPADRAQTAVSLTSATSIDMDDKAMVRGTQLSLDAPTTTIHGARDPLTVQSLDLQSRFTQSESDIVVDGGDTKLTDPNGVVTWDPALHISGNLQLVTKPHTAGTPQPGVLVSAVRGTVATDGDIVTSDGGPLRIEGADVKLGKLSDDGTSLTGGSILSSGTAVSSVTIAANNVVDGVKLDDHLTGQVQAKSLITRAAVLAPGVQQTRGGDVTVDAAGDLTLFGDVLAEGGAALHATDPRLDGGSVRLTSGGKLTVANISTGGANDPGQADERGNIFLHGNELVLNGNLNARAGDLENTNGERNRSVVLEGPVTLGADNVSIEGGAVTVKDKLTEGQKHEDAADPNSPLVKRNVDLVFDSGPLVLAGGADVRSLSIATRGDPSVLFGGDVTAREFVDIGFRTDGVGHWGTTGSDVKVSADLISVETIPVNTNPGVVPTGSVSFGDNLHFKLTTPDNPPTDPNNPHPTFTLLQGRAIDEQTTNNLFAPGRFVDGVAGSTLSLSTASGITFAESALAGVKGSDLELFGDRFVADPQSASRLVFDVDSFKLTTQTRLDADFDVIARGTRDDQVIGIQSGASGTGDLNYKGTLQGHGILLVAGDGPASADGASGTGTSAAITVDPTARFTNAAGTAAPEVFGLAQDANLSSTSLPSKSQFGGGSVDTMECRLESFDGEVKLDSAQADKYTNTRLIFSGATVDFGDQALVLDGLVAQSRGDLLVNHAVTVNEPNGAIDLTAGAVTGVGNLTVVAPLTADSIDLRAGTGTGTASGATVNIDRASGAKFAGGGNPTDPNAPQVSPKHFGLTQDASLAANDLPTRADFANPNIDNMDLALRSKGGSLTFANADLISHTALTLEGATGITVPLAGNELDLVSLDAKGPMTLGGSVATHGDLATKNVGDLKIDGALTLNAPAGALQSQKILSAGALTITGATSKTTAGDIEIGSSATAAGGDLAIGDVATSHGGGSIDVHGKANVKTGVLDASGAGGGVELAANASVDVAGIKAVGATGASGAVGGNGGGVKVTGTSLTLGTIDTSGGRGGPTSRDFPTTRGGDAGAIELNATGSTPLIGILGDLLAVGGEGQVRDSATPLGPLRGNGNAVTVNGNLLLLANSTLGTGTTNSIRGRTVAIAGNVAPGTETLEGSDVATPIPASSTGLKVVADDALTIGGSQITAGRLDLEVHHNGLDLGTKTIHSDAVRLAASDGAGNDPNGVVDLSGLDFTGSGLDANGQRRRLVSLTVEQDVGFGGADGSPIPDVNAFTGTATVEEFARTLELISQDGAITLAAADFPKVAGTRLTLAANGNGTGTPITITGPELDLQKLQLGTVVGVDNSKVGGNATVNGDLKLTGFGLDDETLRSYGNLTVTGDAQVIGRARFAGDGDQLFSVGNELEFGGSELGKNTDGSFTIHAQKITLDAPIAQTISNDSGQLLIDGPLKKGDFVADNDGDGNPDPAKPPLVDPNDPNGPSIVGSRGLSLVGVSTVAGQPAIRVTGTQPIADGSDKQYAIAVANGNLLVSASTRTASDTTSKLGSYQLGGDVLAYGDVELSGEGTFAGTAQQEYSVQALRNPFDLTGLTSGELLMGGVASADRNLRLVAIGDNPSDDVERPAAIHLLGNFANLSGSLELDGSVDFRDATSIAADGDVSFDGRIQGDKGLTVTSGGQVALFEDVAMDAGALSLSGDKGVRFVSTSDTQFVQAGSISLGSGAAPEPSGIATLVRDGNLSLKATGGDVAIAKGQRMVVNGSLDVSAPKKIALNDTAALRISLVSHDLIVGGGATVMANSIVTSARPVVTGSGLATFAVPTRTELSDNIPSDEVLVRQIHGNGSPLSLSAAFADDSVLFPTVPFPQVTGPALFDYAAQTPPPPVRHALARPHVDESELDASLSDRPLWAEELLAYLEQRSLETPGVVPAPAVEQLPPVGARPGDPIAPEDRRVRSAAAEQAVSLYREVFRPKLARDPETGFVDGPGRAAAIRAAFQAPIDVLRRENGGRPVSGTALRDLIASNPSYSSAASYGSQLDQLLAAGELALTPDQKPRFRALLLSEVTPYGIAPAEFETAIQ